MFDPLGQWIGNTYGTHPANLFVEFSNNNGAIAVTIRAASQNISEVKTFIGSCIQNENSITSSINEISEKLQTGITGNIVLTVISENQLEGSFELSDQTKGVIKISRFLFSNAINNRSQPLQIIAKEIPLNYPLKIYKKDINKIITIMQELSTPSGTLIITEQARGTKIIKYANDYLNTKEHQSTIDSLSFTTQTMVAGFTNTLTLNLNRHGPSYIISQSADFLWSHATPILLKEILELNTNKLLGLYKKFGLEINGLLFLTLLVILPSFEFKLRLVSVVGFLIFAFSYRFGYRRISQTIIEADTDKPTTFKEKHPKTAYILLTLFSLFLAAVISFGVNQGLTKLITLIKQDQLINSRSATTSLETKLNSNKSHSI